MQRNWTSNCGDPSSSDHNSRSWSANWGYCWKDCYREGEIDLESRSSHHCAAEDYWIKTSWGSCGETSSCWGYQRSGCLNLQRSNWIPKSWDPRNKGRNYWSSSSSDCSRKSAFYCLKGNHPSWNYSGTYLWKNHLWKRKACYLSPRKTSCSWHHHWKTYYSKRSCRGAWTWNYCPFERPCWSWSYQIEIGQRKSICRDNKGSGSGTRKNSASHPWKNNIYPHQRTSHYSSTDWSTKTSQFGSL